MKDFLERAIKQATDLRRKFQVLDFSKIHGATLVRRLGDGKLGMFVRHQMGFVQWSDDPVPIPIVYFEGNSFPLRVDPKDLILERNELQSQASWTILTVCVEEDSND